MNFSDEQMISIKNLMLEIQNEIYGLDREDLLATTLVPAETSVSEWALTYVYKVATEVGMAKFIADGADDLPPVARFLQAKAVEIKTLGDSYGFSEPELQAWLKHGIDLSRDGAEAARAAIDYKVDETILLGDSDASIEGFLNNSNVSFVTSDAGATNGSVFKGRTYDAVIAMVQKIINAQHALAKGKRKNPTVKADSIVLAPVDYAFLQSTPISANVSTKMLADLKATFPQIKNWDECGDLEGINSGKDRVVLYKRDRKCVAHITPIPFKQKTAQEKGLNYLTPCFARTAGTVVKNLKSIIYCDATASR